MAARAQTGPAYQWGMSDSGIGHVIGRADTGGWSANTAQDSVNYLQYGPYTTQTLAGAQTAFWSLLIDNITYPGDAGPVVELQVDDASKNYALLAVHDINRRDFTAANQFQTFALPFTLPAADAGDLLEFRVFWYREAYIREMTVSLLGPPTGLVATPGSTQVALSWGGVTGATGYNVYRATASGGPYTELTSAPVTGTAYTDATVSAGTVVYYVVTAVTAAGESGYSNQAATPPAAPTNLAVNGAYAQNTLTWTASIGATSYTIYRGTSPGGEGATPVATVTSAPYVDTGLTTGTTYYYTVQAISGGGTGGGSGGGTGGGSGGSSGSSGSSGEGSGTPTPSSGDPSDSSGYFLPTYWGGSSVSGSGAVQPFTTDNRASIGNFKGSAYGTSGTLSCSGPITESFVWQPGNATDTAPQGVVVSEQCSAAYGGYSSSPPSFSVADGLGDPEVDQAQGQSYYGSSSGTHDYVLPTGADGIASLTLSGLQANFNCGTGNGQVNAVSVEGTFQVDQNMNLAIHPGGATQDSSGNWDILVGQPFTPSLTGLTLPAGYTVSYSWSTSGTTFQSWTGTTGNSSFVANPVPNTAATPSWYWADRGNGIALPETVTCTATLTPPAGQGSPVTVTATKKVNVFVPAWTATGTGGSMYVNGAAPNSTGFTLWGHMHWYATVTTPQLPVAFGTGSLQLVQLYSPNDNYYLNTIPLVKHTDPLNGNTGLDTTYPYGMRYPNQAVVHEPAFYSNDDNPNIGVDNTSNPNIGVNTQVYSATNDSSFQDYLMYQPPGSSQWVTLASFSWSLFGTATIPAGGWGSDGWTPVGSTVPSAATPFTIDNTLPSWAYSLSATSY